MVKQGSAKKLTIYLDETDRFGGKPVYEALLNLFHKKGIGGVSVFRGVAGYGGDGVFHTSKMLELSTNLPVKLEIVDAEDVINRILPDVYQMVEKGLVELSDTNVLKCSAKTVETKREVQQHMKLEGKAKMLRVIVSEDDKWEGEPLYEAIVKRFILMDIAGATVYKAVAGYGPHRRFHKKKTLTSTGELPMLITVIDSDENINKVLPILDDMLKEGIVILSDVTVVKYTHRDIDPETI
ncbi:MAG: DUF190 domain-containing protein [Deltaproteobacteria bacterium]|jgi:hypothetical protein|nr:DUF190 domain-containing protein [Deltaproteobacteria bacterium]